MFVQREGLFILHTKDIYTIRATLLHFSVRHCVLVFIIYENPLMTLSIPILVVELSEMSDETKQRLSVRKLSVASQAGLGYQLLKPVVWALLTAVLQGTDAAACRHGNGMNTNYNSTFY